MASQLVCLAVAGPLKPHHRKFTKPASYKKRVMNSSASAHHQNFGHQHVKLESTSNPLESEDVKEKKRKFKGRFEVREPPRLGLWYLKSCMSYILRKARAFYNEFCCDAIFDDDTREGLGYEVVLVDPYFSIPVTPCTSTTDSSQ